jgi:hypothetical protein
LGFFLPFFLLVSWGGNLHDWFSTFHFISISIYLYIYLSIYLSIYLYIYIYIYIYEREETERENYKFPSCIALVVFHKIYFSFSISSVQLETCCLFVKCLEIFLLSFYNIYLWLYSTMGRDTDFMTSLSFKFVEVIFNGSRYVLYNVNSRASWEESNFSYWVECSKNIS